MSRLDSVGLAKQAALGTKQTTMEYFAPVESAEISHNREVIEQEETLGNRFPSPVDYGSEFFELSLAGAGRAASLPRLLSAFFGAPTTTTPFAGVFLHTFDPAAAGKIPVPHSILLNRTDPATAITDLLWDALGNELELGVEPDGFVSYGASFAAIANDDARPEPTVTTDYTRRFAFNEVTATIAVNGAGAVTVPLASFKLNYSNNLDTEQKVLGSRLLHTLVEGNATAEVSFGIREAAAATLLSHYRRALLTDPDSVKLVLTATGPIIAGTEPYKFVVTCEKLEYLSAPANIDSGERLNMVEVSARAAYDNAASKFVTVAVQNAVASY